MAGSSPPGHTLMPLIQIKAPHFVAGLVYDKETELVTNAAPILGWSVGKDVFKVFYWCKEKGYDYQPVNEDLTKHETLK